MHTTHYVSKLFGTAAAPAAPADKRSLAQMHADAARDSLKEINAVAEAYHDTH